MGHVIPQAVSHRTLTAVSRIQSPAVLSLILLVDELPLEQDFIRALEFHL